MKKRILACLLALVMLIGVLPVMALAEDNVVTPAGFAEAVKNAKDGDTITLGEGTFTLYGEDGIAGGKSLTFVGAGKDKTIWNIGTGEKDVHDQGNADFSLKGAKTVTFRNMTLKAGIINGNGEQVARDYMGFAHTDVTVVEDCVIDGRTCYWGYISSDFVNTKFDSPDGYALWYYTGKRMRFDSCVFNVNADGKTINVYREGNDSYTATAENEKYGSADNPIVLNLKDCKFYAENPNKETKQVLNIKEYCYSNSFYYVVNFSGNTVVDGISVNNKTCSRLFQVQGVADGYNCNEDATGSGKRGLTTVNIEGKTVWANGKMVEHNVDIPGGSYDDGVAEGTANKYTEGYKDNAFDILKATDWAQQPDGSYKREITRVCRYCKYKETVVETKRDEVDDITAVLLPALQANTDDHYSYLIGYADGTVRPNGKITRAEVATIFFRLLDDDTRAKYWSSENNFSDVSADKWYNNAVSTLSRMGVIGGYADGTFRPDAPISRAEFVKIAVSFTQNNGSTTYNYFTDVKTTDWFAPYVTAAKDAGLIEGYSDGSFKPESKITRAEACAIVNRTLGRKPSKAHMKISDRIDWPDVQTTDWFYEAIMEATNSHTCTMGDRVETWTGKLPQRDWATLETGWANAYTGR